MSHGFNKGRYPLPPPPSLQALVRNQASAAPATVSTPPPTAAPVGGGGGGASMGAGAMAPEDEEDDAHGAAPPPSEHTPGFSCSSIRPSKEGAGGRGGGKGGGLPTAWCPVPATRTYRRRCGGCSATGSGSSTTRPGARPSPRRPSPPSSVVVVADRIPRCLCGSGGSPCRSVTANPLITVRRSQGSSDRRRGQGNTIRLRALGSAGPWVAYLLGEGVRAGRWGRGGRRRSSTSGTSRTSRCSPPLLV